MTSFDLNRAPLLWRQMIERKEHSSNAEEQSAFFAGLDIDNGAPVLIPRKVLDDGHVHVSGRTGSGKTAAALMSLAFQILRNGARAKEKGGEGPLVVIDLKGDPAFFNAVRQSAAEHGRTFRYFSTRTGDDYHFFDPLQIFQLGSTTPIQLASEFVRAFSLDYGLIYGGLYFTHQNLGVLLDAVKQMAQRRTEAPTIAALSQILTRISQNQQNKDARHIQLCLKFLAECEQVNIKSQPTPPLQSIDMLRVLEDSEVVYFYLELESEAPSLRQIAALALYTLVQACKERRWQGLPTRSTYVIIDEFYHIAGKSFGELLSTVRHLGLHLILANQTRSQLENHDKALPEIVDANTVAQLAYSLTPDEAEYFGLESGQVKEFLNSYSRTLFRPGTTSARESWTNRLSDEELKLVNDRRLAALLFVKEETARAGARIRKLQTLYPIPRILYDLYYDTPLPKRPLIDTYKPAPSGDAPPTEQHHPHHEPMSQQAATLNSRMEAVWAGAQREEACGID